MEESAGWRCGSWRKVLVGVWLMDGMKSQFASHITLMSSRNVY